MSNKPTQIGWKILRAWKESNRVKNKHRAFEIGVIAMGQVSWGQDED